MAFSPSLDSWTTLFLLAAAQGGFLAVTLWVARPGPRRANWWLAGGLICFSVILIDYVGFWSGYHYFFPYLAGIYLPLTFLLGPFFYFYVRALLLPPSGNRRLLWIHFVPALLAFCWQLPFFLAPTAAKKEWFAAGPEQMYEQPPGLFSLTNLIGLILIGQLIWYAIKIKQCIRQHNRHKEISNRQRPIASKQWSRRLQRMYLGFIAGYILYYLLLNTSYFNIFQDYTIAIAMAFCIYGIGYTGYARPRVLSGPSFQEVPPAPKYRHSTLTPGASQSMADKLLEYMEHHQPFLDNELRLNGLADQLGVSKHHLSQVINEHLGKRFSEFVNEYRVREAQRLLRDPGKAAWPVIEIAYAAGFNNKTSFYQSFKSHTGCAPTTYRRRAYRKMN